MRKLGENKQRYKDKNEYFRTTFKNLYNIIDVKDNESFHG